MAIYFAMAITIIYRAITLERHGFGISTSADIRYEHDNFVTASDKGPPRIN